MLNSSGVSNINRSVLGAYYTPLPLAKSLVNWAIRDPTDKMLDPSFGGCAFLIAARDRLRDLKSPNPAQQVFGVDIDESAWKYLLPLRGDGALATQFCLGDFLDLNPPETEQDKYSTIIGNPPYIFHGVSVSRRESASKKIRHLTKDLPLRSSQWAYFVLHSLSFLKKGGRMVMILPTAFLQAEYANSVRGVLYENFSTIDYITLEERIFEGTDEQVMILLADDFKNGTTSNRLHHLDSIEKLPSFLKNISKRKPKVQKNDLSEVTLLQTLPKDVQAIINKYTKYSKIATIGDLFDIKIGTVTGANELFLFTESQIKNLGFSKEFLKPILARPKFITGLSLTDEDFLEYVARENQSYLLAIEQDDIFEELASDALLEIRLGRILPENIRQYLHKIELMVLNTSHGKSRNPWYSIRLTSTPQAFFQYMSASYPRFVLNSAGVCCTNNLHRLTLKDSTRTDLLKKVALGTLSSISWLDAEISGRSYGRGVLKLEPKAIKQLRVPLLDEVDPCFFRQIDQILRLGDLKAANELVDQKLLVETFGFTKTEVEKVRMICSELQSRRRKD
jgi:adenine-specific DNA-methyltransferase